MVEKAIWLDVALLCCIIITCLQLVKIQPHTRAISSHIAFLIKYIYIVNRNSLLRIPITQLLRH